MNFQMHLTKFVHAVVRYEDVARVIDKGIAAYSAVPKFLVTERHFLLPVLDDCPDLGWPLDWVV